MSRLQMDWQQDESKLKRLYQEEKGHQNRTGLQALWYLRQGRTIGEVAELVGLQHRTVQHSVAWYRRGGISEVLNHRHRGARSRKRRLMGEQEMELKALAEASETRTIWGGVHWAEQKYGVTYTYWGMKGVSDRLELRKKVPRQHNPKASAAQQETWKKWDSAPS